MVHLDKDAVERMERFFEFAAIPANYDIIRQDEYGNFMVVLLTGTIAVDRVQPWGEQLRLAEPVTSWARCRCWTAASVFSLHHPYRLRNRRAERRGPWTT